jgi:ABC-2 type transport system ATP-binding protein
MHEVIRTEELTKDYGRGRRRNRGLDGLDLAVEPGEVFGFLGPNGAGKTTTIRLLLDLIHPTSGRAEVLGMDTRTHSVPIRRLVGYVPGELGLYENLTGRELLTYLANLRGRVEQRRVDELAERLELDLHQHVHDLSKGNKQKLGLLQAFMHRPELLVLDEPTSGLDPLVQQEFHRLVGETTAAGGTVFLSSHMLSEVEHLAHRVAIVREGRLAVVEEVTALKTRALRRLELDFARPVPAGAFTGVPGVRELVVEGTVLRCAVEGSVDAMLKAAARFEVLNVVSHEPDLEEIFLAYYRKDASDAA